MITQIGKKLATQIVDTVHDVCGYDINFINKNGIIYASTNTSRIGSFHEIGKKAADTGTVIEVAESDHYAGTHAGVNIPVTHNGLLIAVIGISGMPDEVRKFAYLAEKITKLLIREQELGNASRTLSEKRTYLVSWLLSQDPDFEKSDRISYTGHFQKTDNLNYIHDLLQEFQINTAKKHRILLLHMQSDHSTVTISSIEEKILQLFSDASVQLYMFRYPGDYVAIIDQSFPIEQLINFCNGHTPSVRLGVGRLCDLFELTPSYDTAKIALNSLKTSNCNYAFFDDLTLEILLGSLPEAATSEYLQKTISRLDETDISLLRSYFDHDQSLSKTSAALFLHKNTLQYRLDRIHRICGLNPRTFKDGTMLYLAIQLRSCKNA